MKILIAYDGSPCADAALLDLRRAGLPPEAEALIISVADVWLPPTAPTKEDQLATDIQRSAALAREATRAQALQAVEEARAINLRAAIQVQNYFPDWQVQTETVADSPAWGIIKKADDWKPDLIVIGSHGYSPVSRLLLGSVSQKVLTTAGRSVRIARENDRPQETPVRFLVGVDGSAESEAMIRTVASRVWRPGSVAHVVSVVDLPLLSGALTWEVSEDLDARRRIQHMVDAAAKQLQANGLEVISAVKEGNPKHVLVKEASACGAECIYLGARGLRQLERFFLGSVSTSVATQAHCSVEVIQSQ